MVPTAVEPGLRRLVEGQGERTETGDVLGGERKSSEGGPVGLFGGAMDVDGRRDFGGAPLAGAELAVGQLEAGLAGFVAGWDERNLERVASIHVQPRYCPRRVRCDEETRTRRDMARVDGVTDGECVQEGKEARCAKKGVVGIAAGFVQGRCQRGVKREAGEPVLWGTGKDWDKRVH